MTGSTLETQEPTGPAVSCNHRGKRPCSNLKEGEGEIDELGKVKDQPGSRREGIMVVGRR